MAVFKLFLINPKEFFNTILDNKKYVLIVNIIFVVIYILGELFLSDNVDVSSAFFYSRSQVFALLSSLFFEYLFSICWAFLVFGITKSFKIQADLTSIVLCFLSIKLISSIFIILETSIFIGFGQNQLENLIKYLQFIVELIYLFIALKTIFKTTIAKTVIIQLFSILIVSAIIMVLQLFSEEFKKEHYFKITESFNWADGKYVSISAEIWWRVIDKKLMNSFA